MTTNDLFSLVFKYISLVKSLEKHFYSKIIIHFCSEIINYTFQQNSRKQFIAIVKLLAIQFNRKIISNTFL